MSAFSTFQKVKARLGAARLALQAYPDNAPQRDSMSRIQCSALVELLTHKAIASMQTDERLAIASAVTEARFASGDADQILACVSSYTPLAKAKAGERRKQQNGCAFLEYLNGPEWTRLLKKPAPSVMVALQVFFNVLWNRMRVVNPSEPTCKLMASAAIVTATESEDLEFVDETCKVNLKVAARKLFTKASRNCRIYDTEYCHTYPADPSLLESTHPRLFAHIKASVGGAFTDNQLDEASLCSVDNSFQCRGSGGMAITKHKAMQSMDMQGMMAMMKMCMMSTGRHNRHRQRDNESDDDDVLPGLTLTGKSKRKSLGDLAFDAEDNKRQRLERRRELALPVIDELDPWAPPGRLGLYKRLALVWPL